MFLFIHILDAFFQVYTLLLLVRILSSWIPEARDYKIMQFIGTLTDPFLDIFRRIIPPLGMIDISPIVAFLALSFLQQLLIALLVRLAH